MKGGQRGKYWASREGRESSHFRSSEEGKESMKLVFKLVFRGGQNRF
jgi:hypothetical protein